MGQAHLSVGEDADAVCGRAGTTGILLLCFLAAFTFLLLFLSVAAKHRGINSILLAVRCSCVRMAQVLIVKYVAERAEVQGKEPPEFP